MTDERAIEQLEEFLEIDDWSAVYMPYLQDAIEYVINRIKADRWIPVSERLPEKDGYYLITRLNYGEAVTDKRSFNRHNGYGSFVCNNVTAWKEMPEPYESEANNEQTD